MNYRLFKATVKWIFTSDSRIIHYYDPALVCAAGVFPGRIAYRLNKVARYFSKYNRRGRAIVRFGLVEQKKELSSLDKFTHDVVRYDGSFDEFKSAFASDAPMATVDKTRGITYLAGQSRGEVVPDEKIVVERFGGSSRLEKLSSEEITIKWPDALPKDDHK